MGVMIATTIVWWQSQKIATAHDTGSEEHSIVPVSNTAEAVHAAPSTTSIDPRVDKVFEEAHEDDSNNNLLPELNPSQADMNSGESSETAMSTESSSKDVALVDEVAKRARAERAAKGSWTCRHRWTKWLGQNSMYVPSGLSEHVARYNRLHDRLLREMPISEALVLPLTSPRNTVRYIAWRPVGDDHAGRLLSLVSTYLLGLLTDRVLLINFPYVRHLFCEPFTRSSWIFPQKHLGDLNKFTKLGDALQTRAPLRIVRLQLPSQFTQDDESIFLSCNGNVKTMLSHAQILLVESPVGFAELLIGNPSHYNRLQQLFEDQAIYPLLMQTLLHPANDMWFRIIDAYHVHYTNDYDRPSRLAVHLEPPASEEGTLALKHRLHCALGKVPDIQFSRGRVIYYSPSSPSNNPKFWAPRILKLPPKHHLVTATDENAKKGYLADWRRLLTDIWMASWTLELAIGNMESQTARAMHYYRGKSSWLVSDAGPEGECLFEEIPSGFMPETKHNCTMFRQTWRAKYKTNNQKPQ